MLTVTIETKYSTMHFNLEDYIDNRDFLLDLMDYDYFDYDIQDIDELLEKDLSTKDIADFLENNKKYNISINWE